MTSERIDKNFICNLRRSLTTGGSYETIPVMSAHKREWQSWYDMIRRCTDPEDSRYRNYGGRGIRVSSVWLSSFQAFLVDMGHKPHPKMTIERNDNDGDYTPENCRWVHKSEQAKNRSTTKLTQAKVRQIRELAATRGPWGVLRLSDIGQMVGVTGSMVSRIVNNRLWKEIA